MAAKAALWGGRFEEFMSSDMQAFGASLPVDTRLWSEDIAGSKAHAAMLAQQQILTGLENEQIQAGLDSIAQDIEAGKLHFELDKEDIHMAIEDELTQRIGIAGKKLHIARSRNDQVVTDFRLYCISAADELVEEINGLRKSIVHVAQQHTQAIMPGYTHLQKAQPVLFAQHLLVWVAMLGRDATRFEHARAAADASPLGAAALAGTPHNIDREHTAKTLGFSRVITNAMDAVSDRDFACDFIYAAAMGMQHLSRMCEELILWCSEEFGFVTLSDAYSTGSSIMPQKKNADLAELTRGKTGRVYGDLLGLLTTLKSLPLAYNKDLQEDKEGLFDAHDTYAMCLQAVRGMLTTLTVNEEAMYEAAKGGFMAATDLADWLAQNGVAFRDAHEIVGNIVLFAQRNDKRLDELTFEELKQYSDVFTPEVQSVLDIKNVVAARKSFGGTSPENVSGQIQALKNEYGW